MTPDEVTGFPELQPLRFRHGSSRSDGAKPEVASTWDEIFRDRRTRPKLLDNLRGLQCASLALDWCDPIRVPKIIRYEEVIATSAAGPGGRFRTIKIQYEPLVRGATQQDPAAGLHKRPLRDTRRVENLPHRGHEPHYAELFVRPARSAHLL